MRQPCQTTAAGWMLDGACRGMDPELFFPVGSAGPSQPQIELAKAICQGCLVRLACLSYALTTGQHGIWGGTVEDERRTMRGAAGR